jgi:acetyl-CoA acetyltransferase family protein
MVELNDVFMVEYVRTPFSRSRPRSRERSAFSEITADQLVGYTLRNLFEERLKEKMEPSKVSEFGIGCSLQVGSNYAYAGRTGWFAGGMPYSVPSLAFDRACGSSMSAMHYGSMSIQTGNADVFVASGVEHMFKEPMDITLQKCIKGPQHLIMEKEGNQWYRGDLDIMTGFNMIQTAQKLAEAEHEHINKQNMAEFGVTSHKFAAKALEEGYFKGEIVPVKGHKEGDLDEELWYDYDLSIRKNPSLEKTLSLSAASSPGYRGGYKGKLLSRKKYKEIFGTSRGVITPGNASPLNAGAATCMLASQEAIEQYNLKPMAKIIAMGWAGVPPSVMGRGPVPATEKALKKAGLTADKIDVWEINEAFAAVVLNCMHHFNVPRERVNMKGGAIAIGHPLGASGVRLPGTLARIMQEKKFKYGVATLCCGSGQGVTTILENPNL